MPQHLLIQDPSQLDRKPLHSQLLETARERLKVHIPWLCKTEITVASTFGPWTAATLQQQLCHLPSTYHRGSANSSSVCYGNDASSEEQPLLPSAAATIPFGRRLHDIQMARMLFLPWAQLKSIQDHPANPVAKLSCPRLGLALFSQILESGELCSCPLFRAPCSPEVIPHSCTSFWLSLPPSSSLAASPLGEDQRTVLP